MVNINVSITSNYSSNTNLNHLIKDIDETILSMAKAEYLNTVLGMQYIVDMDTYEDLATYKEILIDKLLGCNCLDNEFLIYIVSKIKKLTR